MGCILGKLATAPGSSLFFPAAATTAGGGGDNKEVQLQAPQPEHIAAVKKDASGWPLWLSEAAGDALRGGAGDLPLDLAGDSPRTTSSLSAAKNPCFLSFSISRNAAAASAAATKEG